MPSFEDALNRTIEYATEEELLNFANKLRVAGGADVLEALIPSYRMDAASCLIARACNFHCLVRPIGDAWQMLLHLDTEPDVVDAISKVIGDNPVRYWDGYYAIALPERIGNTASAFDAGAGWTNQYAV